MKAKPVGKKYGTKRWSYHYLNKLRRELGEEKFEEAIRDAIIGAGRMVEKDE